MFVTANGEVIPCCYLGPEYIGGKSLPASLSANNFAGLVKSWTSDTPFYVCKYICDDKMSSFPANMANFKKEKRD